MSVRLVASALATHMNPPLDYVRRGAEHPVTTRIVIEKLGNGAIRLIDPPGSRSQRHNLVIAAVLAVVGISLNLAVPILHPDFVRACSAIAVGMIALGVAIAFLKVARQYKKLPTIIEVSGDGLSITHPERGHHHFPRELVSKIGLDSPLVFGTSGFMRFDWLNRMEIIAGGMRFRILEGRPRDEIAWLTNQIQIALPKRWFPEIRGTSYAGTYRGCASKGRSTAGNREGFIEVKTDGTVLVFEGVEYSADAKGFSAKVAAHTGARIEVRSQHHSTRPFAVLEVSSTDEADEWKIFRSGILPEGWYTPGVHRLLMTFIGDGAPLRLASFKFES